MTTTARPRAYTRQVAVSGRKVGPNRFLATIAVNEKARDGIELDFAGLDTRNYMRNPVVLWAHDPTAIPIGRTLLLHQRMQGLEAEFEFLEGDDFAARVRNAFEQRVIRAGSIHWLPLEVVPLPGGGQRHVRSELIEWSLVPVPADPDAVRHIRGLEDAAVARQASLDGLAVEIRKLRRALGMPDSRKTESGRSTPTINVGYEPREARSLDLRRAAGFPLLYPPRPQPR